MLEYQKHLTCRFLLGQIISVNLHLGLEVKLIKHGLILMGEVGFFLIKYISVAHLSCWPIFFKNTLLNLETGDNLQQIPSASLCLIIFKQPILTLNFQRRVQISIPATAYRVTLWDTGDLIQYLAQE